MTKQNYELIARALFMAKPRIDNRSWTSIKRQWTDDIRVLSAALAEDNPKFDTDRFFRAATTGEGVMDAGN